MTDRVLSRSVAVVPEAAAGATGASPIPDPRRPTAQRPPAVVFPGFDGLRAIAALMVVVVHSSFPAGFTMENRSLGPYVARAEAGVAVFFLISGFLLYRPFVAARLAGTDSTPAAGYLVRRFMRIVPLYWLALVVSLNVVDDGRAGVHGVTGALQTALFLQGYQDRWALQGLTQAWTLDIEVAFYLAVPIWAWLLGRRRRGPDAQVRVELAALAVTFLASKALHFLVIPHRQGWTSGWNVWLPVWWDLFAMGMALAVLSARYAQLDRQPRWSRLPGSATACWVVAAVFYWVATKQANLPLVPIFTPGRAQDMSRHLFYGLFAFFLLLPAVFGPQDRGGVRRLLASRPLAFLGAISYGIYLWHTAAIDLVLEHGGWQMFKAPYPPFLAIVLALTITVATATHFLVEKPCIGISRGWARRADALVARLRGQTRPAGRAVDGAVASGPVASGPVASGAVVGPGVVPFGAAPGGGHVTVLADTTAPLSRRGQPTPRGALSSQRPRSSPRPLPFPGPLPSIRSLPAQQAGMAADTPTMPLSTGSAMPAGPVAPMAAPAPTDAAGRTEPAAPSGPAWPAAGSGGRATPDGYPGRGGWVPSWPDAEGQGGRAPRAAGTAPFTPGPEDTTRVTRPRAAGATPASRADSVRREQAARPEQVAGRGEAGGRGEAAGWEEAAGQGEADGRGGSD